MIFSENRYPPVGSWPEGMLFRIMLWANRYFAGGVGELAGGSGAAEAGGAEPDVVGAAAAACAVCGWAAGLIQQA